MWEQDEGGRKGYKRTEGEERGKEKWGRHGGENKE